MCSLFSLSHWGQTERTSASCADVSYVWSPFLVPCQWFRQENCNSLWHPCFHREQPTNERNLKARGNTLFLPTLVRLLAKKSWKPTLLDICSVDHRRLSSTLLVSLPLFSTSCHKSLYQRKEKGWLLKHKPVCSSSSCYI